MTPGLVQLLPQPDPCPDLDALYAQPPGVRLGLVTSVDGAAAVAGRSAGLSGPADRAAFRALRRAADVVLVGAQTARVEGYRPVRLDEQVQAGRVARGQRPLPPVAVVSRGAGLRPGAPLLEPDAGVLLLTTRRGAAAAPAHVEAVVAGEDDVDLARALDALRERGLGRVLCEGGPALGGALLRARLVDELCVTTSPLLVGGPAPRLLTGADEAALPLRLAHLLHAGDVLLSRWTR